MRMRAVAAFLLLVAMVLAAGAASPILAQTVGSGAAPNWDQETDRVLAAVKAQYGLTDDQVRQIRPLLRDHLSRMRALFDSYVGQSIDEAPALLKQYADQRADFKAQIDPILNDQQRKDFMTIRAEFDAEMKKAFIGARMQWFERVIGVDATQSGKLLPIVTDSFEKRMQLLTASVEEKDPDAARKALRVKLQSLQGETNAKLSAVLTPEQLARYQDSGGTGAPKAPKPQDKKPQTH